MANLEKVSNRDEYTHLWAPGWPGRQDPGFRFTPAGIRGSCNTDDYVVAVGGVDSLKGKGMVIHVATND